jgi:hypothetical protein
MGWVSGNWGWRAGRNPSLSLVIASLSLVIALMSLRWGLIVSHSALRGYLTLFVGYGGRGLGASRHLLA